MQITKTRTVLNKLSVRPIRTFSSSSVRGCILITRVEPYDYFYGEKMIVHAAEDTIADSSLINDSSYDHVTDS